MSWIRGRIALLILTLAASTARAEVCVTNGSDRTLVFVAEIPAQHRTVADVTPAGSLCVGPPEARQGVVWVFESRDSIEGCSRLVQDGGDTLLTYADFDNCRWASQDR